MERRRLARLVTVVLALVAASCSDRMAAPVRDNSALRFPARLSTMRLPVSVSLDRLEAMLGDRIPRRLWGIDERHEDCIPAQEVHLFGKDRKLTPDIGCRIVGEVERGKIRLVGRGEELAIRLPIEAEIAARDVGGVLKGETATGSAMVELAVRLSVNDEWKPDAEIAISYDWEEPPGIEFVGQRIKLTSRADRELTKVIAALEDELEAELEAIDLRPQLERLWTSGFTVE